MWVVEWKVASIWRIAAGPKAGAELPSPSCSTICTFCVTAREPLPIAVTSTPVVATSRIGENFRGIGTTLGARAPSRARARRRRGGRLSPSLVAARGDRVAPTPTHRAATLGRQAARDAVGPDRLGRARCRHADLEECAAHRRTRDASSLTPRRLQGLSGAGGAERAPHRASFRRRSRWSDRWRRRTDSGAPRGSAESCSSSASKSANARSRGTCARRGPARREDSAGPHSYETTHTRSGLATFCKLTTHSCARSSQRPVLPTSLLPSVAANGLTDSSTSMNETPRESEIAFFGTIRRQVHGPRSGVYVIL